MDGLSLVREQQRVTALLLREPETPSVDALRAAAGLLAQTITRLVEDDQFWEDLSAAAPERDDLLSVAVLTSLDWPRILGAANWSPPPPSDLIAYELTTATERAHQSSNPQLWTEVRERLRTLGYFLLDSSVSPASDDRGWWLRLRDRVGVGLNSTRRVGLAKLFAESSKALLGAAITGSVVALLTSSALAVPTVIGACVSRLLIATYDELRRVEKEDQGAAESERIRQIFHDSCLFRMEDYGSLGTNLSSLPILAPPQNYQPDEERRWARVTMEMVERLRDWLASAGIDLANAWGLMAAHSGGRGIVLVESVGRLLGEARMAFMNLESAILTSSTATHAAASRMNDALVLLSNESISLARFFFESKVLKKCED